MLNLQYKVDKFCKNANYEFSERKNVVLSLVDYHRALDLFEFMEFFYKIQKHEVLVRIAICYDILGQFQKTLEYLNFAVDSVHNVAVLILYKSVILHSLGNYSESQKTLIKYKQLCSKNLLQLYETFKLVFLYTMKLENEVLLREIEEYFNSFPKTTLLLYLMAMIYHRISFKGKQKDKLNIKSNMVREESELENGELEDLNDDHSKSQRSKQSSNCYNQEYSPNKDILLEEINEAGLLYNKYMQEALELDSNDANFLINEGVTQSNLTKIFFMSLPDMDFYQPKLLVEYNTFTQGFKSLLTLIRAIEAFKFKFFRKRLIKKYKELFPSLINYPYEKRKHQLEGGSIKYYFNLKSKKNGNTESIFVFSNDIERVNSELVDVIIKIAGVGLIQHLPGNKFINREYTTQYVEGIAYGSSAMRKSLYSEFDHESEDQPNIDTNYFIRKNYYSRSNYKTNLSKSIQLNNIILANTNSSDIKKQFLESSNNVSLYEDIDDNLHLKKACEYATPNELTKASNQLTSLKNMNEVGSKISEYGSINEGQQLCKKGNSLKVRTIKTQASIKNSNPIEIDYYATPTQTVNTREKDNYSVIGKATLRPKTTISIIKPSLKKSIKVNSQQTIYDLKRINNEIIASMNSKKSKAKTLHSKAYATEECNSNKLTSSINKNGARTKLKDDNSNIQSLCFNSSANIMFSNRVISTVSSNSNSKAKSQQLNNHKFNKDLLYKPQSQFKAFDKSMKDMSLNKCNSMSNSLNVLSMTKDKKTSTTTNKVLNFSGFTDTKGFKSKIGISKAKKDKLK